MGATVTTTGATALAARYYLDKGGSINNLGSSLHGMPDFESGNNDLYALLEKTRNAQEKPQEVHLKAVLEVQDKRTLVKNVTTSSPKTTLDVHTGLYMMGI